MVSVGLRLSNNEDEAELLGAMMHMEYGHGDKKGVLLNKSSTPKTGFTVPRLNSTVALRDPRS